MISTPISYDSSNAYLKALFDPFTYHDVSIPDEVMAKHVHKTARVTSTFTGVSDQAILIRPQSRHPPISLGRRVLDPLSGTYVVGYSSTLDYDEDISLNYSIARLVSFGSHVVCNTVSSGVADIKGLITASPLPKVPDLAAIDPLTLTPLSQHLSISGVSVAEGLTMIHSPSQDQSYTSLSSFGGQTGGFRVNPCDSLRATIVTTPGLSNTFFTWNRATDPTFPNMFGRYTFDIQILTEFTGAVNQPSIAFYADYLDSNGAIIPGGLHTYPLRASAATAAGRVVFRATINFDATFPLWQIHMDTTPTGWTATSTVTSVTGELTAHEYYESDVSSPSYLIYCYGLETTATHSLTAVGNYEAVPTQALTKEISSYARPSSHPEDYYFAIQCMSSENIPNFFRTKDYDTLRLSLNDVVMRSNLKIGHAASFKDYLSKAGRFMLKGISKALELADATSPVWEAMTPSGPELRAVVHSANRYIKRGYASTEDWIAQYTTMVQDYNDGKYEQSDLVPVHFNDPRFNSKVLRAIADAGRGIPCSTTGLYMTQELLISYIRNHPSPKIRRGYAADMISIDQMAALLLSAGMSAEKIGELIASVPKAEEPTMVKPSGVPARNLLNKVNRFKSLESYIPTLKAAMGGALVDEPYVAFPYIFETKESDDEKGELTAEFGLVACTNRPLLGDLSGGDYARAYVKIGRLLIDSALFEVYEKAGDDAITWLARSSPLKAGSYISLVTNRALIEGASLTLAVYWLLSGNPPFICLSGVWSGSIEPVTYARLKFEAVNHQFPLTYIAVPEDSEPLPGAARFGMIQAPESIFCNMLLLLRKARGVVVDDNVEAPAMSKAGGIGITREEYLAKKSQLDGEGKTYPVVSLALWDKFDQESLSQKETTRFLNSVRAFQDRVRALTAAVNRSPPTLTKKASIDLDERIGNYNSASEFPLFTADWTLNDLLALYRNGDAPSSYLKTALQGAFRTEKGDELLSKLKDGWTVKDLNTLIGLLNVEVKTLVGKDRALRVASTLPAPRARARPATRSELPEVVIEEITGLEDLL